MDMTVAPVQVTMPICCVSPACNSVDCYCNKLARVCSSSVISLVADVPAGTNGWEQKLKSNIQKSNSWTSRDTCYFICMRYLTKLGKVDLSTPDAGVFLFIFCECALYVQAWNFPDVRQHNEVLLLLSIRLLPLVKNHQELESRVVFSPIWACNLLFLRYNQHTDPNVLQITGNNQVLSYAIKALLASRVPKNHSNIMFRKQCLMFSVRFDSQVKPDAFSCRSICVWNIWLISGVMLWAVGLIAVSESHMWMSEWGVCSQKELVCYRCLVLI